MALPGYERKALLGHGGLTELKEKTGRSLTTVSRVIWGQRRNRTVEVAAARMIGRPVDEVFEPDTRRRRRAVAARGER